MMTVSDLCDRVRSILSTAAPSLGESLCTVYRDLCGDEDVHVVPCAEVLTVYDDMANFEVNCLMGDHQK